MGVIRTSANSSVRDFVTDGVPASGAHEPIKSEVRGTFGVVEDRIDAVEAAAIFGIRWTTNAVRVRSTGNVAIATALENGDTLNGVTLATGNHVFLGSQTAPAENGIYTVVASGAASRATFADTAAELAYLGFLVSEGTVGAGERWTLSLASSAITVGTTALNFSQVGVEVSYAAEVVAARDGEASLLARMTGIDDKLTVTTNVIAGDSAGASITTADDSVMLGRSAGVLGTEASGSTAVGAYALQLNTTAVRNTAIGRAALINCTGAVNTAVGGSAGNAITGGTANTFLGYEAGSGSQLAMADNAIAIGYQSYTTADNQAVFGNATTTETLFFGALRIGHGGPELARLDGPNENYFLGDAGPATLPSGGGHVAFGKDAGNALTTGVAGVFIGKDAGKAVTTGADHTFVGSGAGIAQVSGVGCSALGRLAGKTSVSATNWTALGDTALEFNVSDSAVGVGYGCGRDHTSGTGFCGVGTYAGGYGNANRTTVMGTEALGAVANVDYGDDNAVFGYRGMGSATGSNNAGLGAEVFINLSSGSYNTGIGRQAGSRLTTGTYCTFLGYNTGQPSGQKVDAVNSTAIGANAITTKSNQVVIGDSGVVETVLRGVQIGTTFLVAALPAAATAGAGARAFVTDANATTFASIVAGSGANGVPVYSDGTNWRIG
jgi:hypothetical protein